MLPIGDDDSLVRRPRIVSAALLAINALAFVRELTMSPAALETFVRAWGTTPAEILSGRDLPPGIPVPVYATLVTAMFLHADILHFAGNMLYLWVFGNNIESALGHARFVLFYFACGIAAGMAHVFASAGSEIPSLGASGAISGVLGAYLVMFPRGRVRLLAAGRLMEAPAFLALGMWIALQLLSGVMSLGGAPGGGVAWWAHIGGFAAGAVLGPVLRLRERAGS